MKSGRKVAAFFDVDNTLINDKSMFSFMRFFLDVWLPSKGSYSEGFSCFYENLALRGRGDRSVLNRLYYESLEGYSVTDLSCAARAWFEFVSKERGGSFWIKETVDALSVMKSNGFFVVAVSGSSDFILGPILDQLGMDFCLATSLKLAGFNFTGDISGRQLIGEGKKMAIMEFSEKYDVDLDGSWAFGDHLTDLPMMELVGNKCVVAGDFRLEKISEERGWGHIIYPEAFVEGGVHV